MRPAGRMFDMPVVDNAVWNSLAAVGISIVSVVCCVLGSSPPSVV
jgi:hypothetical protein